MKTLVTGATGFVGRELLPRLEDPRVLSRSPSRASESLGGVEAFPWEPNAGPPPADALEGVDVIMHLAGESVAEGRWNDEKKRRIRDSRVLGTRHLVDAMESMEKRPGVFVCASAVGWYGDRGDEILDESAKHNGDFLAEVCVQWEKEAMRAESLGVRVVCVRIGVVLGRGGGALSKMLLPFKMGMGGRLGHGNQYMPWIHVGDLADLFVHCAKTESVHGPVNGVAPTPVTNREFTKTLGKVLRRPTIFPVPEFGLRIVVGEMAQILMASQRVVPRAAEENGFSFRYPDLEPALEEAAA
ncbi:MAG: TIGR01777 family oxidoreductase [Planctomycetota bacterium]